MASPSFLFLFLFLIASSFSCGVYAFAGIAENDIPQAALQLKNRRLMNEHKREEWIRRSLQYYSKVTREERRRSIGQLSNNVIDSEEYIALANKHYFALYKIKQGNRKHAECIYRRIIEDLMEENEEDDCDHAKLAVTTLLLALLLQQKNDHKGARKVFLNFFRMLFLTGLGEETECACSAKVLQAYALFEMKQGNSKKSRQLAERAVKLDPSLAPVLKWKQFRDVVSNKGMGR
eukprot:CAMPEP_0202452944 /NCGR_PEP_ID=MMETSP1360-20130828/11045_1 /ASSEMBLY_ACC=CAM_ASM_000848 /TAXON_ID=515479 /ORGANISM="Licmophora paradoxa, Strain CCMP2313" /LENGTH=233 /DNA_ID=CAMNT_0049071917 /DNA_START=110 /DNA_END=807 /DNA_ORIENTATION=-